jgi:hypothetical protein
VRAILNYVNPFTKWKSFPQASVQLILGSSVGFLVVHLLGWREDVSFISGTVGEHGPLLTACFGMLYMIFYFGITIVVPILVLALGIFKVSPLIFSRGGRK